MHFSPMEALVLAAMAVGAVRAVRAVGGLITLSPNARDNTVSSV